MSKNKTPLEQKMFRYLSKKRGIATKRELFLNVFENNMGLLLYYISENLDAIKVVGNKIKLKK